MIELSAVGIVIIGDETLTGRRSDKHMSHVIEYFNERGVEVTWVYYLGDDLEDLVHHFRMIRKRGDVCFSFGGIGATPDDRTRKAMALAFDMALTRHPGAVKCLEDRFGEEAYPNRILMAELPEEAELVPNAYNNIPGFSVGSIYCLPGFPEMAWAMMEWVIENHYILPNPQLIDFTAVIVHDVRESQLIPLLSKYQAKYPDLKISCLPRFPAEGVWQAELGVRGERQIVSDVMSEIKKSLAASGFKWSEQS